MTDSLDDFPGTDRFQIVRRLGAGGMGVVYEAHDRELDARVALKLLPNVDAPALFNFKREFRSLATIVHPNLIALHELISDGTTWFFTMEVVDGEDFLRFVRSGDRCDLDLLIDCLRQLVDGMSVLHGAGVLHRDLKPSNVLVRGDGRLAILDFGLAMDVGAELLPDEMASGTLAYMSPEQSLGEPLTPAADWYSAGVMLFEALTGRLPFVGAPMKVLNDKMAGTAPLVRSIVAGVPDCLSDLCSHLLVADPAHRAGAQEIRNCLTELRPSETRRRDRGASPASLPFVGRERHLSVLDAAAEDARAGRMAMVHVHGRSGAGKSVLVSHFLDRLRERADIVVLAGRCYEQESVPYKGVDTVVDALTRYLLVQSDDDVDDLLPTNAGVLARLFPVLERVDAIARAPHAFSAPEPRELRRQGFEALRALLTRIGQTKLLVLYIDDLQWGDVDSAALLSELIRPPNAPPMLFLAAYRSEYRSRSVSLRTLLDAATRSSQPVELEVEPFDLAESTAFAATLLGEPVAGNEAERIARESGGNPYFILELVRYLRESGEWSIEELRPDRTLVLDDVLWSRVQRLPTKDRELLELLAVSGRPLQLRHAFTSVSDRRVDQNLLARMRAEHMVRSTGVTLGDELDLFHDRIRESIAARLEPHRLRGYHATLASTLESAGDVDPETVGSHFEGAGDLERAGGLYATAATDAMKALAFERAAKLYRASIDLRPGLGDAATPLRIELGHALANAGRGADAASAYREAAVAMPSERTELLRMAATQLSITGRIDEGRAIFRDVMRAVGLRMSSTAVETVAALLARRAWLRIRGLRPARRQDSNLARDLVRVDTIWSVSTALSAVDVVGVAAMQSQALLLALRAGEPRRLALCLAWEAVLTGTGGVPAAARAAELLASATTLAHQIGDPHAEAMAQLASAWIAFLQFRIEDTVTLAEPAETQFRERCTGVWWELGLTRTMMSWAYTHGGDTAGMTRSIQRYYGDATERGDLALVTNLVTVVLPHLALIAGDPAAARAHIEEGRALWPHRGFHLQHVSLRFSETYLHLYLGEGRAAFEAMQRDWSPLRWSLQMQNQVTRVLMLDLRARSALAARGSPSELRSFVAQSERDGRRIRRERAEWAQAFADRIQAAVAWHRGDRGESVRLFRSAADGLDRHSLRLHAAATRRRLGELLGGDEGRDMVGIADAAMLAQQVRDPARLTDMFVPPVAGA